MLHFFILNYSIIIEEFMLSCISNAMCLNLFFCTMILRWLSFLLILVDLVTFTI